MVKKNNPKLWDFWSRHYLNLWVQTWVLGPTRKIVLNSLKGCFNGKGGILDIGCGVGQLCAEMKKVHPYARVRGIDISSGMIVQAQSLHGMQGIEFENESLDDQDGTWDIITTTHSFPYIPDKSSALSKMNSLLKLDGCLLIVMAHTDNLWDLLGMGVVKLTTWDSDYLPSRKLMEMLDNAGFVEITCTKLNLYFFIPSVCLISARKT